jgi:hypothetical protein
MESNVYTSDGFAHLHISTSNGASVAAIRVRRNVPAMRNGIRESVPAVVHFYDKPATGATGLR